MPELHLIPLFPLPVVVCPTEPLPLHIFEDRYKQMIADCRREMLGDKPLPFGVSLAYNNKLYTIGCSVEIAEVVNEYPDGQLDIITTGLTRYKMIETYRDRAYMRAQVEYFEDDDHHVDLLQRERAITLHMKFRELIQGETFVEEYEETDSVSFRIAHSSGFDVLQKQKLLEMRSETERLLFIISYFEKAIPEIERSEEIKRRVRSNGHFKNFDSPNF